MFKILDKCKDEPLYLSSDGSEKVVKEIVKENTIEETYSRSIYDFEYVLLNGHMSKRAKVRTSYFSGKDGFVRSKQAPGCSFKFDNVNSLKCGKIHIRKGTRPQTYFKAPQNAFDFYNMNKEVFDAYAFDLNKSVVVNGCYETNRHTLEQTAIQSNAAPELRVLPTYEEFLKYKDVILTIVDKLKIQQIGNPIFEQCLMSHFKPDSQPGFTQVFLNNNHTKLKAFKTSSKVARNIYNKLNNIANVAHKHLVDEFIKNKPKVKGLYSIGARNKRDYTYENYELASSRAVHMPEFHNEIVISAWMDGVNESLKLNTRGPLYIGNSITTYERLERDIKNNTSHIEGDWKRFDSTYRIMSLIVCTCITRLYYPLFSKRADVHFFWIFYVHLIKDYYIPGGYVIRILNGLPSGTKCTSIWNSIFNLFALLNCCSFLNFKKLNFAVGGDDFIIMYKDKVTEQDVQTISDNSAKLGMKFKFCVLKDINSNNVSDFPFFYKYSVKNSLPIAKPVFLMERILAPQNLKIKSNIEYLIFLDAQLPTLGYPSTTHLLFYSIYKNTYNRVFSSYDSKFKMTIKRIFKMHYDSYNTYRYSYKKRTSCDDDTFTFENLKIVNKPATKNEKLQIARLMCNKDKVKVFEYKFIGRF